MKKILNILGTITLIGTSTTNLVACNTPQYTEKELAELKEKNNIKTKDGILEWIVPQEKPFNNVDDKWYYVVWRGDEIEPPLKLKYDEFNLTLQCSNFQYTVSSSLGLDINSK